MSQRSDEFLEQTIKFWQPRVERELTPEDARQIGENMSGFFKVLSEWAVEREESDEKRSCSITSDQEDSGRELPGASESSKLVIPSARIDNDGINTDAEKLQP